MKQTNRSILVRTLNKTVILAALILILSLFPASLFAGLEEIGQTMGPDRQLVLSLAAVDRNGDLIPDDYESFYLKGGQDSDLDGDGFSNAEELARGSDPLIRESAPGDRRSSAKVFIIAVEDNIYAAILAYSPLSMMNGTSVELITYSDSENRIRSSSTILLSSQNSVTKRVAQGSVTLALAPIGTLASLGKGIALAVLVQDGELVLSTTTTRVRSFDEGLFQEVALPESKVENQHYSCREQICTANLNEDTFASRATDIYLPVPRTGPIVSRGPSLCLKRTAIVGVDGALITHEVVSAECVDGYEGVCPSNCPALVGTTYQTVDPLVLAGQ